MVAYACAAICVAVLANVPASASTVPGAPPDPGVRAFGHPASGESTATFALTEDERPPTLNLAPAAELAAWAFMLIGVGGVGGLARSRTQVANAKRGANAA